MPQVHRIKILLATHNENKARELGPILGDKFDLLTLSGLTQDLPVPAEDGEDFLANARIKAHYYAQRTGYPALADDSGMEVAALDNRPGIYSARYGGEELNDEQRYRYLLNEMIGFTDRSAKFTAALVLARPEGGDLCWIGELHGQISLEPIGTEGFGYDPLFLLPSGLTLAQMTLAQKNEISHRARAAEAMKADLVRIESFLADCADPCGPVRY
ncbi:MAG: RdgB/HAM1 family non-canonical purine NTP pyrophosphatase [Deltaproteobacteria bacterium]|jgi:XTP/dITP diphosphohydrolase|nr:RdgB/HAM1 family non-canonical purine NTP pyrophosphatase [Deltaproteobacteria bacterium]